MPDTDINKRISNLSSYLSDESNRSNALIAGFNWTKRLINTRKQDKVLRQASSPYTLDEHLARGGLYATIFALNVVFALIIFLIIFSSFLVSIFGSIYASLGLSGGYIPANIYNAVPQFLIIIGRAIEAFIYNNPIFIFALITIPIVMLISWFLFFWIYLYYPRYIGNEREREINRYVPDAMVYCYTLTHGGRGLEDTFRELARQEEILGEVSQEAQTIVNRLNAGQFDLISAIDRQARETPSEKLEDILRGLSSVTKQGADISNYFEKQAREQVEEQKAETQQMFDFLEIIVEVLVILIVVPMFIVILGFVSMLMDAGLGGLLEFSPLINIVVGLIFGILLYFVFQGIEPSADKITNTDPPQYTSSQQYSADNRGWELYEKLREYSLSTQSFIERPYLGFLLTLPLTVMYLGTVGVTNLANLYISNPVQALVFYLVVPAFLLFSVYMVVYEIKYRRIKTVEGELRDIIDEMKEANERGRKINEALDSATEGYKTRLSNSFQKHLKTSRVIKPVLITHVFARVANDFSSSRLRRTSKIVSDAVRETGNISDVLGFLSQNLREKQKLDREQKSTGSLYAVIIIFTSLIMMGVLVALDFFFISRIAEQVGQSNSEFLGDLPIELSRAVITYVSFNAMLVAGFFTGILRTGNISSSLKYMFVFTILPLIVFLFI